MIHLGDITKINGAEIPSVDCVTGGSPCQELSVAGNRAGLDGARSGLFMEQIRVIKEKRGRDIKNGRTADMARPRYMVWENVPGAFSSNGGEDFRIVLEETARIADKDAVVPRPPKGGWTPSGCIVGDGWSIAWRVHDAQFWGVPQRRKRIALVADFGGLSAPEILFERQGLFGHTEQSGETRQAAAGAVGAGASGASGALNPWDSQSERVYPNSGVWHSLNSNASGGQSRDAVFCLQGNGINRADTAGCNGRGWKEDVSYTLNTIDRPAVAVTQESGTNRVPAVYDARGNGDGETVPTITGDHENRITDYTAVCIGKGQKVGALNCMHDQQNDMLVAEIANPPVRRLTPLECERLQGYPDGWTDIGDWTDSKGKKHNTSDSARYKALGNSIALPFWFWLLRRISAQYERPATLGSLFDGIGGFPLCWERCNGRGTAVWASEVDEFCIAVTKARFGE